MSISPTRASIPLNICQRLTNGAGYYLNQTKKHLTNGISNVYCGTVGKLVNFPYSNRGAVSPIDFSESDILGGSHESHSSNVTPSVNTDLLIQNFHPVSSNHNYSQVFATNPLTTYILSFLRPKELALANRISTYFHELADSQLAWKTSYQSQGMVPSLMPVPQGFRQGRNPPLQPLNGAYIVKTWAPDMFGKDTYYDHIIGLKSVGTIPPIPASYIPRPGFKLILIPKELEIEVDANSPIVLAENGQLIERISSSLNEESKEAKRILKVPVTLNNINFLFKKCFKNSTPIRFSDYSWEKILEEHGNTRVTNSYWSYQKTELIGLGLPFAGPDGQEQLVQRMGLVVAPLILTLTL